MKNEETIDANARIDNKCFRRIILVERFPRQAGLGERARVNKLRMVGLVFALEQLDMEREIVACQDKGYAAMKE